MGKVFKDKKSHGCAACKPHKHGWAPKKKDKFRAMEYVMHKEAEEFRGRCIKPGSQEFLKNSC